MALTSEDDDWDDPMPTELSRLDYWLSIIVVALLFGGLLVWILFMVFGG